MQLSSEMAVVHLRVVTLPHRYDKTILARDLKRDLNMILPG